MSRFFPRSLFGQTLLILLAGLILSHAVGSWIYTADREQAVRTVGGFAAAQRIANLTRLVQDAPRDWRQRIVSALSDQTFRVALSDKALAAGGDGDAPVAEAIRNYLADQLALESARQPVVSVTLAQGAPFDHPHVMMGPGWKMGMRMMHGDGPYRSLAVAVPLAGGGWLNFATALPEAGSTPSRQLLISMAMMAVIILGVSIWAVRRVTAPLSSLALAAERLGRDVTAAPLPETGTIETRRASRAFNDMQSRLRNLIENRTRMLAAISHDLRTPLTLLRLRADSVDNSQERDKMLATIAEMDAMIGEILQFARDEALDEALRPTDVTALVQSVADDMTDAGLAVTMGSTAPLIRDSRPVALKRAIRNLLDNAIKHGKTARVDVRATPAAIETVIDDDGPGIPEQDLARVFEPFYRVEGSRNQETGGVGLGLAIARSIVEAHGGTLTLANRPEGGLRVTLTLPK
jgi:signal transduction histidine kinase